MASKRPPLVGRRFLSVCGRSPLKLSRLYDWDWRAGWVRAATTLDSTDPHLQVLLEFDEQSWQERDWYNVYNQSQESSQPSKSSKQGKKGRKSVESSVKHKTEEKTEGDDEDVVFQLFLVEERLTVAHRPNCQGSSATSGTLYPAIVFKPLVDQIEMYNTKKLPVEFLSDRKLVFQEYSQLKTMKKWDPSLPGLAVCDRSERDVVRWQEEWAGQSILLGTPTLLLGYRVEVYRVEGTTQWFSAVIVGHNESSGEFTVTDDTVLEEHYENPSLVQFRILGQGVVDSILEGKEGTVAPRRSRPSVYRTPRPSSAFIRRSFEKGEKPRRKNSLGKVKHLKPDKLETQKELKSWKSRKNRLTRRKSERAVEKPSSRSEVSGENSSSPKSPSGKPVSSGCNTPSSSSSSSNPRSTSTSGCNTPDSLVPAYTLDIPETKKDSCSESDSDRSTSGTARVSRVLKKTFKGKAVAIVKPFSNFQKKQSGDPSAEPCDYKSEETGDGDGQRRKSFGADSADNNKKADSEPAAKRLKPGGKSLAARKLKFGPELKSVRVRLEKFNSKTLGKTRKRSGSCTEVKQSPSSSNSVDQTSDQSQLKLDTEDDQPVVKVESAPEASLPSESRKSAESGNENPVKTEAEEKAEEEEEEDDEPGGTKKESDSEADPVETAASAVHRITDKPVSQRNEDCPTNSSSMEEDSRSDSGVSTLRSDGARSSGDERSGSRSSAISDDRSGSRPSASVSVDPDIKIVGTVQGDRNNPHKQWRDSQDLLRREQELSREIALKKEQEANLARHFQTQRERSMGDPRNPLLPPSSMQGLGAHAANLQAQLSAHYGPSLSSLSSLPGGMLPPGLSAHSQAMLQYQLAAASQLGLLSSLSNPGSDLLLERERQIAQDRDRQLREKKEQEHRERERLEKERLERERREREERERLDRQSKEAATRQYHVSLEDKERRDRERESVEQHFQMSMEMFRKVPTQYLMNQRTAGNWSNIPGFTGRDGEADRRSQQQQFLDARSRDYRPPPPAHGGPGEPNYARTQPHKEKDLRDPRAVISPKPTSLYRTDQYPGKIPQAPSPGAYHRGPSPHQAVPSPHHRGGPSPHHHRGGPSPQHRGGPSPHHGLPSPHHRGPSPHNNQQQQQPPPQQHQPPQGNSPHHSPPDRYPAAYKPGYNHQQPKAYLPYPSNLHNPHPAPPIRPKVASPVPGQVYGKPTVNLSSPGGGGHDAAPPVKPAHQSYPQPAHGTGSPWNALPSPRGTTVNGSAGLEPLPLDLGSSKRKSETSEGTDLVPVKSTRVESVSPTGQLHRVTEPATLGAQAIGDEATPITSVVNTAALNLSDPPPAAATTMTTTTASSSEAPLTSSSGSSNTSSAEPTPTVEEKKPEFQYVHKLKKAWMKTYTAEPSTDSNGANGSSKSGNNSGANSLATSPQLTRATPSPVGSTKSTGSGKGFPSAVKSAAEALRVNGYGSPSSEKKEDEDEMSSEEEDESKPPPKPKKVKGKPGPKPKGKPGPKPKAFAKKKAQSESENSDSEKESDSSKTSKKSENGSGGKKRGRKPGKPKGKDMADEPKLKKLKTEETPRSDPFAKPSVSQLKKTGDSFLQDASCFEVAPKLNKCRECRWSHAQRQKQSLANIFCRFYAFRRLRYTKNGQIAQAGFCDPKHDAQIDDMKLWLPSRDLSPAHMEKETAERILEYLSAHFYTIYKEEQEAANIHRSEDLTVAWKRVVQGVREMCDVCEATLFNNHWACGKCGFVVCIDCFRSRAGEESKETETSSGKDRDEFTWLFCTNRQSHQPDAMMLTQIIAGDALEEVNTKLRILARLHRSQGKLDAAENGWQNPDKKTNGMRPNGVKDETEVKEEYEDNDTSNLRDLICSVSDYSWGPRDDQPLAMTAKLDKDRFPDHSAHSWLCDGAVLRLEDPADAGNLDVFRFAWRHSHPAILAGLADRLDGKLWSPDNFADLPDHGYDPANPETSAVTNSQPLKKFFDGFTSVSKRPSGENGEPLCLKLRENWPVQEDQFLELLPNNFKDVYKNMPLREYMDRDGVLNLASRLPDCFVRLDLGPRLWGGYVKSTYSMQYNVSDTLQWCVFTGKDGKEDISQSLENVKCDKFCVEQARENKGKVAALWHVFHPTHAVKLKEFILKICKPDGKGKPKDPLYEQTMYLKDRHLDKLLEEENIRPWVFTQLQGEGVAIPAGAPFQVKLLQASLMVQTEFVSPEHMDHAMQISHSDIQQFDDRLQIKNLIFHACKDALSVLYNPENK